MSTKTITIGYTKSDRLNDYIPVSDGYREGAEQVKQTYTVDIEADDQSLLEGLFVATNAPLGDIYRHPIAALLMIELYQSDIPCRAICVGDTVELDAHLYECRRVGWDRI